MMANISKTGFANVFSHLFQCSMKRLTIKYLRHGWLDELYSSIPDLQPWLVFSVVSLSFIQKVNSHNQLHLCILKPWLAEANSLHIAPITFIYLNWFRSLLKFFTDIWSVQPVSNREIACLEYHTRFIFFAYGHVKGNTMLLILFHVIV